MSTDHDALARRLRAALLRTTAPTPSTALQHMLDEGLTVTAEHHGAAGASVAARRVAPRRRERSMKQAISTTFTRAAGLGAFAKAMLAAGVAAASVGGVATVAAVHSSGDHPRPHTTIIPSDSPAPTVLPSPSADASPPPASDSPDPTETHSVAPLAPPPSSDAPQIPAPTEHDSTPADDDTAQSDEPDGDDDDTTAADADADDDQGTSADDQSDDDTTTASESGGHHGTHSTPPSDTNSSDSSDSPDSSDTQTSGDTSSEGSDGGATSDSGGSDSGSGSDG